MMSETNLPFQRGWEDLKILTNAYITKTLLLGTPNADTLIGGKVMIPFEVMTATIA